MGQAGYLGGTVSFNSVSPVNASFIPSLLACVLLFLRICKKLTRYIVSRFGNIQGLSGPPGPPGSVGPSGQKVS